MRSTEPRTGAETNTLSLGIAPVTVPDYLESPWMVVRLSDTEIRYSTFHKWGEPLKQGVQRVLAEDLGRLLGTDQIKLDSWRTGAVDVALVVTINRFDVAVDGQVVLDAQWQITGKTTSNYHRVLRLAGSNPEADPAGAARTMSEALEDLSRAIAAGIRR